MKIDKHFMQMVAVAIISAIVVFSLINHGQKVVVVNEGGSRAPFVGASMIPGGGEVDPDWWQYANPVVNENGEEAPVYCIKEVTNVLDGDTFDAVLEWDEETENDTVRIRLAGVNCPERFDQNCWLEALDKTTQFLFEYEDGNQRTASDLRIQIVAEDNVRTRYVGLVFKKDSEEEKTLGYQLLEKGLALPCFSYLIDYELIDYAVEYLSAVETARKRFTWRADSSKMSVWGPPEDYSASIHGDLIDITLDPLLTNEVENVEDDNIIHNGDIITIEIDSDEYIEAIKKLHDNAEIDYPEKYIYNMSGYSLLDESSSAFSRFFIPTTTLECYDSSFSLMDTKDEEFNLPYLRVYSGMPNGIQQKWIQGEKAYRKPNVFMLRSRNLINDDGDTIFLRDADRRVIAWAYWDGENYWQADEMSDYLESLE